MRKLTLILFIAFFISPISANFRKLYVDDFRNIIGNVEAEKNLLAFAKTLNVKELILFDLDKIHKKNDLTELESNYILANFIKKAKTKYGIQRITASGETAGFFIEVIHKYNLSRKSDEEKFDVYNLEFEYWNFQSDYGSYYCENYLRKNGIPCTREGAFNYYKESLHVMKLLSKEYKKPVLIQAYIAKCTSDELDKIEPYVDMFLVAVYENSVKKVKSIITKNIDKFKSLSRKNNKISIILSSEPLFLGGYFKYNSITETEKIIQNDIVKKSGTDIANISFTYYNYSNLIESYKYFHYLETGTYWTPE